MAAPFVHPKRRHAPHGRHTSCPPPTPGNHLYLQPVAIPPAADNGSDCAERRRHALPQAVDEAQHARVRAAVVQKHDARRHGDSAACNLQEENEGDAYPDDGAGGGRRRGGGRWKDGEEGSDEVADGEEGEEPSE